MSFSPVRKKWKKRHTTTRSWNWKRKAETHSFKKESTRRRWHHRTAQNGPCHAWSNPHSISLLTRHYLIGTNVMDRMAHMSFRLVCIFSLFLIMRQKMIYFKKKMCNFDRDQIWDFRYLGRIEKMIP